MRSATELRACRVDPRGQPVGWAERGNALKGCERCSRSGLFDDLRRFGISPTAWLLHLEL